jgi:leucine dehydrogenase
MERVAHIGDTVRRVFDEAASRGVTPLEAAEGLAAERLAAGNRQSALVHGVA